MEGSGGGGPPPIRSAARTTSPRAFLAGWSFAIAGDMLYYAVIAITTLRLNAYIHNPYLTVLILLVATIAGPLLVSRFRSGRLPRQ